ncbi:hypothetical protein V8B97DRAFT_2024631 [Scleroderma yunnanense]
MITTAVVPYFKDLTNICPKTPTFILASQQLSIWHSNYVSTAIAIIAHFLSLKYKSVKGETNDKDTDERKSPWEICDDLLTGLAFFCPNISRFNTTALKAHSIKEGISLCCAAGDINIDGQISIHCKATTKMPLKINKVTGKESSAGLSFSEWNWGSCTCEYFMSVNKCDVSTLKEIVSMANALNTSTFDGISSEDGSCQDNAMANDQMAAVGQCKNICRNYTVFL